MKKILLISILAIFIMVAISFTTVVSSNTTEYVKKKESPLYKIRTDQTTGEKLGKIMVYIKTKYIGERIFWLPNCLINLVQGLPNRFVSTNIYSACPGCFTYSWPTFCKGDIHYSAS